MINTLPFQPHPALRSCHLQMIVTSFLSPGREPPSVSWRVDIGNSDFLSCEVSTPVGWKPSDPTVVLVHGLGGSHTSGYMIRMARKLFAKGIKAVRVNLRGCGSGKGLSKLLYNAGTSQDVLKVVQSLKASAPDSEIVLAGFSLGGNIALKLAGELGSEAKALVKCFIAVCAPLDLAQTVDCIQERSLYHNYYLKKIKEQASLQKAENIPTLFEFDDKITAPPWGYRGALEYYHDCSSIRFLPHIQQTTHLLFSKDDPFIRLDKLANVSLPNAVRIWVTEKGSHMGFLGRKSLYWMDDLLLNWIEDNLVWKSN